MGKQYSKNEFDINNAKFLVEQCLSNDCLYYKYLESIKKLDDSDFEELFKGNTKKNYKIEKQNEFLNLVHKFEDYSKILYEFHKNDSKFDDIVLLWKSNICIFELYELTEEERQKKFKEIGLSTRFQYDLLYLLRNTIEANAEGMIEYMKERFTDLYTIITYSTNEEENLKLNPQKDNTKGTFSSNIFNIINSLILCGLPIFKNYLKLTPNLDSLSKKEAQSSVFSDNVKKLILKIFKKNSLNSPVHKSLLELTKNFKNSKQIENLLTGVRNYYYHPMVSTMHLAFSFLSLVDSIKSFNVSRNEFKKNNKIFSRELSSIYSDFLRHKEELPNLDMSQTEESISIIKEIHKKILKDKEKLLATISAIKSSISNTKKDKMTATEHDAETQRRPPRYEAARIVLGYENRADLYRRIDQRVSEMVNAGLFEEVEALLASGLSPDCTAMQAIGYKEAVLALKGELTREQAADLIRQGSRRYAKRQLTWFGRWEDCLRIQWSGEPDFEEALQASTAFLRSRGYAVFV